MRRMRMMGFGGIAAAVTVAVGAFMAPAYGQAAMFPGGGGGTAGPPVTSPADPAMGRLAGPVMAPAGPGDSALAGQLAAARLATAKYATDLARAKADGYQIITMMMPNMGFHFMNPHVQGFNVRKPQILVYEHGGGKWQLGALEWVFTKMPSTPPLANATFGSFPAACHHKDGTFVPDENSRTCPKKAPGTGAAFNFWHPDLITMHVWIWYPNPAGLFSSTNPLVAPFNGG